MATCFSLEPTTTWVQMNRCGHCWQMEHVILFFLRNKNLCLRLGLISAVQAGWEMRGSWMISVLFQIIISKRVWLLRIEQKCWGDWGEGGPGKVCGCILFQCKYYWKYASCATCQNWPPGLLLNLSLRFQWKHDSCSVCRRGERLSATVNFFIHQVGLEKEGRSIFVYKYIITHVVSKYIS